MRKIPFLVTAIMVLLFAACKKTDNQPVAPAADVTSAYKSIAAIIMSTAKANDQFRQIAYTECNKQVYGDYYVRLSRLLDINEQEKFWDASAVARIKEHQQVIALANLNEVTLFIPSLEKHPEKATPQLAAQRTATGEDPVAVVATEYDPATRTCPGYMIETNGVLHFYATIDESFA